jgi:hypothetical protein
MKVVLLQTKEIIEYFDNLTTIIIIHRGKHYENRED